MTREDAVERLNALKQFIGYDKDSEIVKATQKSLDMAIKALEHPEKNVIAVVPCGDAISRAEVLKLMQDNWHTHNGDWAMQESMDDIRALPSVTPQEPFKPMVEIDLDYVIKQKYIEREVLDKIRAEIIAKDRNVKAVRSDDCCFFTIEEILEILDKYKAD